MFPTNSKSGKTSIDVFPDFLSWLETLFWPLTRRVTKKGRKKDIFHTNLKKNMVVDSILHEGTLNEHSLQIVTQKRYCLMFPTNQLCPNLVTNGSKTRSSREFFRGCVGLFVPLKRDYFKSLKVSNLTIF